MEQRDLNRMFDALAPTPEQEQAVLDRLLQTERKDRPMKKLKKLTVLGIAAVLMVISCAAAAVVTGIDQRILEYFGSGQEQAKLLVPCALPVDITVENNGAVFHVSQVLMDRYSLLLLADFTAPEGTVLDESEWLHFDLYSRPKKLNQDGKPIPAYWTWGNEQTLLDDGDPLDNHLTVLYEMLPYPGFRPDDGLKNIDLVVKHLVRIRYEDDGCYRDPVFLGDWSCQIPFSWQDMGYSISSNQTVGQLNGLDIAATEIYLSPRTLEIRLEPAPTAGGLYLPPQLDYSVTLTATNGETVQAVNATGALRELRNGETVLESGVGSFGDVQIFRLNEIIDPSQFQGGTITLDFGDESVNIPLDGLEPAE